MKNFIIKVGISQSDVDLCLCQLFGGSFFLVKKILLVLDRPTLDIIRAEYFDKYKELSLFYLGYDNTLVSNFLILF